MSRIYSVLRTFLPYCLERVEGDLFLLRNRYYKPVAVAKFHDGMGDFHFNIPHMTELAAQNLSVHGHGSVERIYFFDDATAPWLGQRELTAYETRLAALHKLLEEPATTSAEQAA